MLSLAVRKEIINNQKYTKLPVKLQEWTYGRTKKFIKRNTLKRDIERGVMFLSERSYSNVCGSTKSSALFCLQLKKYLDFSLVYRVDLTHNNRHWYTMRLFFKSGYVVMLKGFSFGYWGEGSRGAMAILKECGFKEHQIERIFDLVNDKFIRMYRRV